MPAGRAAVNRREPFPGMLEAASPKSLRLLFSRLAAIEFCRGALAAAAAMAAQGGAVKRTTMVVNPAGEWVSPIVSDLLAALQLPDPADDPLAYVVENLGYIKLQTIEGVIVEIELRPCKVELQALLAVQQQLQATDARLFRIRYLETAWQSEICSSVEHAIERLSELCAPVFMPATNDLYVAEARDLSIVFDDDTHRFRPLVQKWRVSFGYFDSNVIALAVQHDLLSSLTVVGIKPLERDPLFRFIGQGHSWAGNHLARPGESVENQPDRQYGRWLAEFYKFVASTKQPHYDLVTVRLQQGAEHGEPPPTVCYERLLLPWKTSSREVFVTSCLAIVELPASPADSS